MKKTHERLVSEEIAPNRDSFDTDRMATGEPGLPRQFTWRKKTYDVAEVIRTWKSTGPCTSGSDEQYVRKHFYKVRTKNGDVMTLYCSRQLVRFGRKIRGGWVLYSIGDSTEQECPGE